MEIRNGFEPSVGGITSKLQGIGLASLDNTSFCKAILGEEEEGSDGFYNGGFSGKSTDLIYAIPVNDHPEEEEQPEGGNVIVNLLMQLKAFQNGSNEMLRNGTAIKNQLVKQLQVEGAGISSQRLKNQVMKAGNAAVQGKLDDREYNRVINSVMQTIKKKT